MKSAIAVFLFILLPVGLVAESVVVQSGEHVDFSRLVVQFDQAREWEFGRVQDGYELRVSPSDTEFDGDTIFDRIPRSRINLVTFPGPGRMRIALGCDCTADAFEYRDGRLVVDIRDRSPDLISNFESSLAELADGMAWDPANVAQVNTGLIAPLGGVSSANGQVIPNLPNSPENTAFWQAGIDETFEETPVSAGEIPTYQGEIQGQPESTVDSLFPLLDHSAEDINKQQDPETVDDLNLPVANDSAPVPETGKPLVTGWPQSWDQNSAPPDPDISARVNSSRSALIKELSRAAAQGLIEIPILPKLTENPADTQQDLSPGKIETIDIEAVNVNAPIVELIDHLNIETAIDRDTFQSEETDARTEAGYVCLSNALFNLAEWGPEPLSGSLLSDLRANLIKEFDAPDESSVEQLAKRYLFYGFGAETEHLLEQFPIKEPALTVMVQMAQILDGGPGTEISGLATQLTCATAGVLWAVLSEEKIPTGIPVDTDRLLQTLSGLPVHLRRHLGPGLVDRFLTAGDVEIAAAIRDIVARTSDPSTSELGMINSQIALHDGDVQKSLSNLESIVQTGGVLAPLALAELIDVKIKAGFELKPNTVMLADAMAREHRGTELGERLLRASIHGLIRIGRIKESLLQIEAGRSNQDLSPDQSALLNVLAHSQNVTQSTDQEFLHIVYEFALPNEPEVEQLGHTKRLISERMIKLGLPGQALRIYAHDTPDFEIADRQIMADAELALGNVQAVGDLLGDDMDARSRLLRARASEQDKDYEAIVPVFIELDMTPDLKSAAWRAGDWQVVANEETGDREDIANRLLASALMKTEMPLQDGDESNGKPISAGRKNLADSSALRASIQGLLETSAN